MYNFSNFSNNLTEFNKTTIYSTNINLYLLPIYSPIHVLLRSIFYVVGECVSIFGCIIAITALIKYLPNLKKSTALIMGSLFVTNAIAGLGACYYSYWNMKLFYFKISPCLMEIDFLLSLPMQQLPGTVMYFQVSLLCVERYIAIVHPFKYDVWMSLKRVKILIGVTWIIISPIILNYIFGLQRVRCGSPYTDAQRLSSLFMIFILVSVIITYTYSRILVVALKQRKKISAIKTVVTIDLILKEQGLDKRAHQINALPRQEFKAAKTVGIVVGLFYISWLPMIIGRIINVTASKQSIISYNTNELGGIFLFSYIDFAWLIYGASNKEFRKAYKKVLTALNCCQTNKS